MKTMRAFVYSKITNRKIAVIEKVVYVYPRGYNIVFENIEGETFTFDTKEVKTTTYQN